MKYPQPRVELQKRCAAIALLMAGVQLVSAQSTPDPTETVDVGSSELYIYKADPAQSGLNNPVLFVEGMDLYNARNQEELYRQFNREGLIEELQAHGRDVIILNFDNANRKLSDSTIDVGLSMNCINTSRASVSTQDTFTVIGVGMGGLASRLALAADENTGRDFSVDTWISLDAPHEGANLPLSFQKFADFYAPYGIYTPELEPLDTLRTALDQEAAKSMLLVHRNNSDDGEEADCTSEREGLINLLDTAGYPATCRSIGISNGSGRGVKQPFEPGDQIFQWENYTLPYIDARLYALPRTADMSAATTPPLFLGIYYMYDGAKDEAYSHYPLSLDNAPGATGNMIARLYETLPHLDGADFLACSNYCAVPTVSALGIPIEYIDTDLSQHPEVLALSPFDEVYTAPGNGPAGEINTRTKSLILRAVLEQVDTDGDGYSDYIEYLIGTDCTSPESSLNFDTDIALSPETGQARLQFEARPHTRYIIRHTPALGEPWTELCILIPDDTAKNVDMISSLTNAAGFFAVTAEPVDPVTDYTAIEFVDSPVIISDPTPYTEVSLNLRTE